MSTDLQLRTVVLQKVMSLHEEMLWPCIDRWIQWRPDDYLSELRRIRQERNPDAATRLRLPTLDDPTFFFWSIFNTQQEVFPDFGKDASISVRHLIGVRNAAIHGDEVNDASLRFLDECGDAMTSLLSKSQQPAQNMTAQAPWPVQGLGVTTALTPPTGLTQVLAFYVVCDKSASMAGEPIEVVNTSLKEMHRQILSDPVAADKCKLGIISFSSRAEVELHLTSPSSFTSLPVIAAEGITNYGSAFSLLKQQIDADLPQLATTHRPLRPVVFFLTDGAPSDELWHAELVRLVDAGETYPPTIVVLPIGDVPTEILEKFVDVPHGVTPQVQALDSEQTIQFALRKAIQTITASVVSTVHHADDELVVAQV